MTADLLLIATTVGCAIVVVAGVAWLIAHLEARDVPEPPRAEPEAPPRPEETLVVVQTPAFVVAYAQAFLKLTAAKMVYAGHDADVIADTVGEEEWLDEVIAICKRDFLAGDDGALARFVRDAAATITGLSDPELRGLALKHYLGSFSKNATFEEIVRALQDERARIAASPGEAYDHHERLFGRFPEDRTPCRA